jgi:ferredoxin
LYGFFLEEPPGKSRGEMDERAEGTAVAPADRVWVCGVCGRRARSRWGYDEAGKSTVIDDGYDTSCMSHAVLCHTGKTETGTWVAVELSPNENNMHAAGGNDE